MRVNIGVIQNVAALGALCRERGIIFHVDAAQATGKAAIDLATLPVDLMSLTAHRTYGPKELGALYVRNLRNAPHVKLDAQIHGGGNDGSHIVTAVQAGAPIHVRWNNGESDQATVHNVSGGRVSEIRYGKQALGHALCGY